MSKEQLEVIEELELEIDCCHDPEEKAEYERTLDVCRELAYGLAEGMIEAFECDDGEITYFAVA